MIPLTLPLFTFSLWISTAISQSLAPTTTTTTTYSRPNGIICYKYGDRKHVPVKIADCRPLFNSLKSLPGYRHVQPFVERQTPILPMKRPRTPPYIWHDEGTFCTVEIMVNDTRVVDKFSFEQARSLATEILQDCESGWGGESVIGEKQEGWYVRVLGIKINEVVSEGTAMFEGVDQGDGTLLADSSGIVQTSKE
ncbi:hypothetical protein N7G274_010223 [Stereocaulon virgatum]|uniref:Uncharacterized protein n=1 Tax=Stereocaulon virgatum TaxID=373712 RepID=A0ABR3ZWI6_9LECA